METYNPQKLEQKWQNVWNKNAKYFVAKDFSRKKKAYMLVEFPYPSGEGLHVGHCRSYTALDVICRKKRMGGENVLFPMGWDAFGLPTENYAVKTGIHPKVATKKNTANFKRQLKSLGFSFGWDREINTTDGAYYKWTQWIFLQLFKRGLAYKAKMPINWCPVCKIGLANEEVVNGSCERCGNPVVKKEKEQWMLKITQYAERLIDDLAKVDYPERVKTLQKDWIGKSEGWEIIFGIKNSDLYITVFTTRNDTLFGAAYLVVAPEHEIILNLKTQIANKDEIAKYIEASRQKTELERISETKEKTGVEMRGIKAINPVNGEEIPIFVADYVLAHYGTGAIMAVPAHDQRDFDFSQKYNLPITEVIRPAGANLQSVPQKAFEDDGVLVNSGEFSGLESVQAREKIGQFLAKQNSAKKITHYKLRDWIFSRQRYWGEPIPVVFCEICKQNTGKTKAKMKLSVGERLNPGWVALPEKNLPLILPRVKNYAPTETGESPLAKVRQWVNVKCPRCKNPAKREVDVMPNWAGSNWYYLRYCDPKNKKSLAGQRLLKYWMPVDWYNGGMEHATLHLLYSRFIYKFLWDIGAVPKQLGSEPYKKRTSHGMVLGEGGIKMSKSKGNVINPDKVAQKYGADTLRVYELFMGPFDQAIAWSDESVGGVRRFLERVWRLAHECHVNNGSSVAVQRFLHKLNKKIDGDLEGMKFNTTISSFMEFVNFATINKKDVGKDAIEKLLVMLAPFAPHIAEELWSRLGHKRSVHFQVWPQYDANLAKDEKMVLVIQVNGSVRDKMEMEPDISENEIRRLALTLPKVQKWIAGKTVKKTIFIPNRLVNFVV